MMQAEDEAAINTAIEALRNAGCPLSADAVRLLREERDLLRQRAWAIESFLLDAGYSGDGKFVIERKDEGYEVIEPKCATCLGSGYECCPGEHTGCFTDCGKYWICPDCKTS